MSKVALRLSVFVLVVILGCLSYYTYAKATHGKVMARALENCSARTAVVLSHTDHDIDSLAKALRNINEAIVYVDGLVADVHVHEDGSVHFNDEQSFAYMKLCGDTLRKEKGFLEAVIALDNLPDEPKKRPGNKDAGSDVQQAAQARRERAYDEYMTQHKQLREALTEMRNENAEISGMFPLNILVDIGSIEHAQREIDFYPTRNDSTE